MQIVFTVCKMAAIVMLIITGIVRLGQGKDITVFVLIFKFFELLRTREFSSFFGVRDLSTVLTYTHLDKNWVLISKGSSTLPSYHLLLTSH